MGEWPAHSSVHLIQDSNIHLQSTIHIIGPPRLKQLISQEFSDVTEVKFIAPIDSLSIV